MWPKMCRPLVTVWVTLSPTPNQYTSLALARDGFIRIGSLGRFSSILPFTACVCCVASQVQHPANTAMTFARSCRLSYPLLNSHPMSYPAKGCGGASPGTIQGCVAGCSPGRGLGFLISSCFNWRPVVVEGTTALRFEFLGF